LQKNDEKKRKLSVSHIPATKKEDFCVNGFLFLMGVQWRWFFSLNMVEKVDRVMFVYSDLVGFYFLNCF
jgi:hypothetical protein